MLYIFRLIITRDLQHLSLCIRLHLLPFQPA
ncbi:Uncharacterised protein [Escherichia coli]|uniref:Uncharacterized protein n=1 Tax=Escherichia coli TaxID=562 RepID=A0A376MJH4_ECOLX|nr:Uncharacterised protein [Escherichia coli]